LVLVAHRISLKVSQTGESTWGEERVKDSTNTRTSYNSWVPRSKSPIVDTVYRRAADLMRIDEALLRHRASDEEHEDRFNSNTLAEDLQLVHYDKAQGMY
jgi:prolyl 4-hydroxylase